MQMDVTSTTTGTENSSFLLMVTKGFDFIFPTKRCLKYDKYKDSLQSFDTKKDRYDVHRADAKSIDYQMAQNLLPFQKYLARGHATALYRRIPFGSSHGETFCGLPDR